MRFVDGSQCVGDVTVGKFFSQAVEVISVCPLLVDRVLVGGPSPTLKTLGIHHEPAGVGVSS